MWLLLAIAGAASAESPGTQNVSGDRIAHIVEQTLAQRLAPTHPTAKVSVSERVGEQILPAGALQVDAGAIAGPWPRFRAGVPVRLQVDGRTVRTLTVWVEAHDPRAVLTYRQDYAPMQAGHDIAMRSAVVDMACCSGSTVDAAKQLAGLRSKRAVRAGEPVLLEDFEPQPDVARQQRIEIEVANGPVRLLASGIALSDGRIGERIAVRADQSQAVLHGRVAASNKVVVDE